MKYLNHRELEAIAFKILDKYRELPEVKNSTMYRVEPELLLSKVLNLKIIHTHLSLDNSILGMTAKTNALVEVFEEDDTSITTVLDNNTIFIEKDLKDDLRQRGRYNFTVMRECSHQILNRIFPEDDYIQGPVHFSRIDAIYSPDEVIEERMANALAAELLMPYSVIVNGMSLFGLGKKIRCLNRIHFKADYKKYCALADFLGVSKTALAIRMKQLGLLEREYLRNPQDMLDIMMEVD